MPDKKRTNSILVLNKVSLILKYTHSPITNPNKREGNSIRLRLRVERDSRSVKEKLISRKNAIKKNVEAIVLRKIRLSINCRLAKMTMNGPPQA